MSQHTRLRTPALGPGALLALLAAGPVVAQGVCTPAAPVPVGTELRLNIDPEHGQHEPNVAATPEGRFLTVWRDDRGFTDLAFRHIEADGQPGGPDHRVLVPDDGRAMPMSGRPAPLALAGGDVRIAWSGAFWEQTGPTMWTMRQGIVSRRWTSAGTAVTPYLVVNENFSGDQAYPGIAGNGTNSFSVTWSGPGTGDSLGTFTRIFTGTGEPLGPDTLVNVTVVNGQFTPAVASDNGETRVVVWRGNGPGDDQGIFMRRVDGGGSVSGSELRVNTTVAGTQLTPAIAMHGDGRLMVVWAGNGPGDDSGVFGQRYRANGTPLGGEFRVNETLAGNQFAPSVAAVPGGGYVVAWNGAGPNDATGIFLRRYDEHGTGHGGGGEVLVNTTTADGQSAAQVAVARGGETLVVWRGAGVGDTVGAFAQAFARPPVVFRGRFEPDDAGCTP